jgi:hypothetical protein
MVWDTCRDLAACFTWKQVYVGFTSLALRLAEARRRVVHVAPSQWSRRSQVEDRRIDAMGGNGPFYLNFTIFNVLVPRGIVVIYSFA